MRYREKNYFRSMIEVGTESIPRLPVTAVKSELGPELDVISAEPYSFS